MNFTVTLSVKAVVKLGSNLSIYLLPIDVPVFAVKQIKAVNILKGYNYLVP